MRRAGSWAFLGIVPVIIFGGNEVKKGRIDQDAVPRETLLCSWARFTCAFASRTAFHELTKGIKKSSS
jgi:hypothetical protein